MPWGTVTESQDHLEIEATCAPMDSFKGGQGPPISSLPSEVGGASVQPCGHRAPEGQVEDEPVSQSQACFRLQASGISEAQQAQTTLG